MQKKIIAFNENYLFTQSKIKLINDILILKERLSLNSNSGYTFFPAGGTNIHVMLFMTDSNIFFTDLFDHNQSPEFGNRLDWTKTDSKSDYKTYQRSGYNIVGIIIQRLEETFCKNISYVIEDDFLKFSFTDIFKKERHLIYKQVDHTLDQTNLIPFIQRHNIQISTIICKAVQHFIRHNPYFLKLLKDLSKDRPKLIFDGNTHFKDSIDSTLIINDHAKDLHKDYFLFCYDGIFNIINTITEQTDFKSALILN